MPRSGTKLLRAMLNQHPRIHIPAIETEFFPYWVADWDRLGVDGDKEQFYRFYLECLRLPFFTQNTKRGLEIDWEEWYRRCDSYTPAAVFRALMHCVLAEWKADGDAIWGDKSPSYTRHVPLLMQQFPTGKVIHIVRDVRDHCLSIQKAWGKSVLRAAQRWSDDVSKLHTEGVRAPSTYIVVRYEDLLSRPKTEIMRVCQFVGVGFVEDMVELGVATENRGAAKGLTTVMSSNVRKYETRMSANSIAKIETVACSTLRMFGYPCNYAGAPARVPSWKLRALQVMDGCKLLQSNMSERGLLGALRFHLEHYRTSGSRFS